MRSGIIGLLTIGQSPRIDVTPSIQEILGEHVKLVERGGLDGLSEKELSQIAPGPGDTTYVSRLSDGRSVKIGKSKLLPLLQQQLRILEEEADSVIMLCTGDFPTLASRKPILYPDKVLCHTASAVLTPGSSLGLIIPLEEQREQLIQKWQGVDLEIIVEVASPYEESDISGSACALKEAGADLIVLDCMGYSEAHKAEARKGSGLPVVLSRTLVARIAAEMI